MTENALAPWHLWGDTKTVELIAPGGASNSQSNTQQILRVNYGRPDTWRFLFHAVIVDSQRTASTAGTLLIRWVLTIGVGRASIKLNPMGSFIWNWIAGAAVPINRIKFTTEFTVPLLDDGNPADIHTISTFEAQDIQLEAEIVYIDTTAGNKIDVALYGSVAPNVHIRPEWFSRVGVFPGREATGR